MLSSSKSVLLAAFLAILSYTSQAGTLTCGNVACEEAASSPETWPAPLLKGIPVRDGPRIEITVPQSFERISRFLSTVTFFYSPHDGQERSVSLMGFDIPKGRQNGLLGGWDTLRKSEKDGIKSYFYKDKGEIIPTYTAAMINTNHPSLDGGITFLILMTPGLSESEFKSIMGSAHSVKELMYDR